MATWDRNHRRLTTGDGLGDGLIDRARAHLVNCGGYTNRLITPIGNGELLTCGTKAKTNRATGRARDATRKVTARVGGFIRDGMAIVGVGGRGEGNAETVAKLLG